MRRIRRITLQDFRSYRQLDLVLDGRSVALSGANGSGKTNLLEALSMVSPGRGLRRAALGDMQRQGTQGGWGVGVQLMGEADFEPTPLSVMATPPAPFRKVARVDGSSAPSAGVFLDYLNFSWLTPAQDRLFVEGASERRRFLDRMTLSRDKAHAQSSTQYEKAMRQRTAALLSGRSDPQVLTILERQMAENGVAIAASRRVMAGELVRGYAALRSGAFPSASLSLSGRLEEALGTQDAATVEDDFAEALARSRRRDAEAGRALIGPHRSDFEVIHLEKAQPARLCSTGEQKALLIGLVLAHAAALDEAADAPLFLLLDEVAAHLDSDRRAALADILTELGCQAFMTGTDSELFAPWGARAQHFNVAADGITEQL
ncbi:DNA replication/repair protein RecF [Parvularcula sp. LCG005]|uniref:DNA replication/repair protein RecF n=1 Tax=Parvularcula sp. LCG005 TaxID=3078805 RepID=UPI0029427819|nr:DNA replication/repair protein RecF [Parvularcula sp. LCG005]WOI53920.1 DNA replication/repair protein RecF [Parvularcula sp. LCG005]